VLTNRGRKASVRLRPEDFPIKEFYQQYQILLAEVLQLKTIPWKNASVLLHMMGYFRSNFLPTRTRSY
jgi:uncharacterized protein YbgA (DUF1722 family)